MSEPKLVSPLLDQFVMGQPISEHHGVRCYPAMQKDSDSKYIVKIISIPASQRSLDALLLAGAFSSPEAAQEYFRELADGVIKEAEILQQLSKLEGFISCKGWQIEPMEEGTGYNVYLLNDYRRSLDRRFRRETMTHLAAVNLGLDMCAALAVSRRCGYLYINLKPGNIFVGEDQNYRIGDLGFVPLSTLQHASLPDRYRSAYTPPEIADAYCSLNTTVDIYSAGLILYQAYNNGQLPFADSAPAEPLPPPLYADSEMSQIILKACDPNPENRWKDPLQMGKALVSYMQRNSVNDIPIVPVPPVPEVTAPEEVPSDELPDDDYLAEDVQAALAQEPQPPQKEAEEEIPVTEENSAPEEAPVIEEAPAPEEAPVIEEAPAPEEAPVIEEAPAPEEAPVIEEAPAPEEAPVIEETPAPEEAPVIEEAPAPEEAPVIEEAPAPEEVPVIEEAPAPEETAVESEASDEDDDVNAILALVDELIAHEIPDPVVVPASAEMPEEAPSEEALEDAAEPAGYVDEVTQQASEEPGDSSKKRSFKGLIIFLLIVALGLGLFTGGYAFYQFSYLQHVDDISLVSSDAKVSVKLTTDIDNSLLTIVCKDTYGNTQRRPVVDNIAVFENLNPGTKYDFTVEISGFHSLVGKTKASLSTAQQTSISNLVVETGIEDGTAILSFAVQGPDTAWEVICTAPGETTKTFSCINHTATLRGLTPGVTYQIQLQPAAALYLKGEYVTTYTPVEIVYAQDPQVVSFRDNKLTISWSAPAGSTVKSWIVRCYDETSEITLTVSSMQAVFENLDPAKSYKVEIKAVGMRNGVTVAVPSNIVHIYDLQMTPVDSNSLRITWNYSGNAPEGGWRLQYKINGGSDFVVFNLEATEVTLPLIPNGQYEVSIFQSNNSPVLNGTLTFDTPPAENYEGYWLRAESFDFHTCLPTDATIINWDTVTLTETFAPGAKASMVIHTQQIYRDGYEEIKNLYVIRNSEGAVVTFAEAVRIWADILEGGFGIMNLPTLPANVGSYTVDIYFNGYYVGSAAFQIAAE